jgi:hypothetical protein
MKEELNQLIAVYQEAQATLEAQGHDALVPLVYSETENGVYDSAAYPDNVEAAVREYLGRAIAGQRVGLCICQIEGEADDDGNVAISPPLHFVVTENTTEEAA